MLALIYTKGVLHDDILVLYRQIRTVYEKILLSSNHFLELQEVEHHMWKLHYELIDEFRKRTRQRSNNGDNVTKNNSPSDNINSQSSKGLEEFKSFLSQATEFYRNLIVKLRRTCGLPAEVFLNKKDRWSSSIDPKKLHACQHTCHRLVICLGDLARYTELFKKPDACEWSTAAMYYLEATRTWPDSGNPHNQVYRFSPSLHSKFQNPTSLSLGLKFVSFVANESMHPALTFQSYSRLLSMYAAGFIGNIYWRSFSCAVPLYTEFSGEGAFS